MRTFLLTLLLMAFSMEALAGSVKPGAAWVTMVESLQRQGIQSVGALKLSELKAQGQGITWHSTPKVPAVITGARTSAYYLTKTKEIFMADDLPKDVQSSLADLEMHEVLGALGYEDDQYMKSTALRIIIEASPSQRTILLKDLGKDLFHKDNLRIKEGGTSVSGGGDIRTIVIKNQVLREIMKTSRVLDPQFLKNFPLINFEPVYAKEIDYIAINYKFHGPQAIETFGPLPRIPIKNGFQDALSFFVPMQQWDLGPKQRRALIKGLRTKVLGFYPAYLHDKAQIEIPICRGTQSVKVPKTSDPDVLYVQKFRWGFLNKCDRMMEASAGTTSPGIPEWAMPGKPGHYYYECGFTQGKNAYSEQVVVPKDSNMMSLVDIEIEEGKTLTGVTHFDGQGGIRGFILKLDDGDKSEYVAKKTVTSPLDQKISYRYKNKNFMFGCERR